VATWLHANNSIDIDQCNFLSQSNGRRMLCGVVLCNKKNEMAVKKTIAVVATENENAISIVTKLASGNYRLLLISKDKQHFTRPLAKVKKENPDTELIIQDCVKDGCWEADIIILYISSGEVKEVGERIREVSTQKVVIIMSDNIIDAENIIDQLKMIIPNSRLIIASNDLKSSMQIIENKDQADLQLVLNLLKNEETVF
jgi:8-hydroxy-5-deazaflavin:NADPH oxidoreductase